MNQFNIIQIAKNNGMNVQREVKSFSGEEFECIIVSLERFKVAVFKMDNSTFEYNYSYTYNALTDKTTKRTPKLFKNA